MEKNKILLVEDDSFVSDIYQVKLIEKGFAVSSVTSGIDAIKKVEEEIPDIILLDIIMPYMDGLEVLEKLKSNDKWKNIPVILLTNLSDKENIDKGLNLGADDYLIKSHFTPSEVIKKVELVLNKK